MSVVVAVVFLVLVARFGAHVYRNAGAGGTPAGKAISDGAARGRKFAAGAVSTVRTGDWDRAAAAARLAGASTASWYARRVSARANRTGPRLWDRMLTGPRGALPENITGSVAPDELAPRRERRPPPAVPAVSGDPRPVRLDGAPPVHRQPAPSPPAPAAGQPPAPQQSPPIANGRTPAVSTGAAEKAIEGIAQIHAEAAAGNITAKHAAIKAITEVQLRFAAMSAMLARQLAEPGSHYGPEITEPLVQAATHLQAGAMASSEADASLTTLMAMSIGSVPGSGRQAPHHSELAESAS